MNTISKNAHYRHRVQSGNYVARRLRQGRYLEHAATAEKATRALLVAGRAAEDVGRPVQEALADRDAADTDLDGAAQASRARLAGRSATANREPPYTLIYPQGVTYYTAAPIGEEKQRYGELKRRHEAHLPAKDEVRVMIVGAVDAGLAAWEKASTALDVARTEEMLASSRADSAADAFDEQIERIYGTLVAAVGRKAAESFFPKHQRPKKAKAMNEAVVQNGASA